MAPRAVPSPDFSPESPRLAGWQLPSAPKGRSNKAQANGLGLGTPHRTTASSPVRAKHSLLRLVAPVQRSAPFQGFPLMPLPTQAVGLGFVRAPLWGSITHAADSIIW